MTGFQKLCLATTFVVFALIVLGGVVRATESGLGCPDWPTCHGRLIPQWEKHTLIEYSHRLTASVAGFMVLGIVVTAWRSYRHTQAILLPAFAAGLLIVFQAGLGGATVLNELPPEISMVHMGTALIILALLCLLSLTSLTLDSPSQPVTASQRFRQAAILSLVLTYPLMLAGSYAGGAGYGLACSGWPLCNGELLPSADATSVQIIFMHRVLALLLGVSLVALAWLAWQGRSSSRLALHTAVGALVLFILQALLGAANVWTQLNDFVRAGHLALGTLVWLGLIYVSIRLFNLHYLLQRQTDLGLSSGLAGVPR